jgi:hypothetical protein
MLLVVGAALTTFKNGIMVNDSASQIADANQNLRAGTNQLMRDLLMAGRIIGPSGIALPSGAGVVAFSRPGPGTLSFGVITNLDDIMTGNALGPVVNGTPTDLVTIMMVDAFMPILTTPPAIPAAPTAVEGTIAPDASSVALPTNALWVLGDPPNNTPAIQVGDLIYFQNASGNAIQTVTSKDPTNIYFGQASAADFFNFNQRGAPLVPVINIKVPSDTVSAWTSPTTLYRAVMITYYVDNTTKPGTPRLTRVINHFSPLALAGVVEDLKLTYDLVDGTYNPVNIASLPWTDATRGLTYVSNQIRKVNVSIGVRSDLLPNPAIDYIRNRVNTAVDVRSLASVNRYGP